MSHLYLWPERQITVSTIHHFIALFSFLSLVNFWPESQLMFFTVFEDYLWSTFKIALNSIEKRIALLEIKLQNIRAFTIIRAFKSQNIRAFTITQFIAI